MLIHTITPFQCPTVPTISFFHVPLLLAALSHSLYSGEGEEVHSETSFITFMGLLRKKGVYICPTQLPNAKSESRKYRKIFPDHR